MKNIINDFNCISLDMISKRPRDLLRGARKATTIVAGGGGKPLPSSIVDHLVGAFSGVSFGVLGNKRTRPCSEAAGARKAARLTVDDDAACGVLGKRSRAFAFAGPRKAARLTVDDDAPAPQIEEVFDLVIDLVGDAEKKASPLVYDVELVLVWHWRISQWVNDGRRR